MEPKEKTAEERIKTDADDWLRDVKWVESYKYPLVKEGYVAGATAEHKRAAQETAQLRDLVKTQISIIDEFMKQDKKLREALKELIPIAERMKEICADRGGEGNMYYMNRGATYKKIIENARKLTGNK